MSGEVLEGKHAKILKGVRVNGPNNSPAEIDQARRFVASQAHDVEDCREMLMMLGLIGQDFGHESATRYGRGPRRRIELDEERKAS